MQKPLAPRANKFRVYFRWYDSVVKDLSCSVLRMVHGYVSDQTTLLQDLKPTDT